MSREDHNPGGGRSQDDLKGKESGISRLNDAQLRFSADLEQLTVVEAVVVADGYTTIGMASFLEVWGHFMLCQILWTGRTCLASLSACLFHVFTQYSG